MLLSNRRSLTLRLTLLFATGSTLVLLALGYVIERSVDRHFTEQDLEVLNGKMELARHALARTRSPAELKELPQRLNDSLVGHHGVSIAVVSGDGKTLFSTPSMRFPEVLLKQDTSSDKTPPFIWNEQQDSYRGISSLAPVGIAHEPPAHIVVAIDISSHRMFFESFRITLWLFMALAAVSTGILGWIVTRRALVPLHEMKRVADQVTANSLGYRLPVDSVPVELAELAHTLNEMLVRLEDSFKRLSDFSSDLAHELRTPISNLMTQTQVALARPRSEDEYRELLYSNSEEFERLARMISDMLYLAKADNGLLVPDLESIDLAQEVQELLDFYEALAEASDIRLYSTGAAHVKGDKLMLRRAMSNLLSNALRYSEAGSSVRVNIAQDSHGTTLAVENHGQTIAPEHLPRLFDRFYRVDASRHRASEGVGLGLAITRSIIQAHRGSIAVTSTNGLTRVTISLPQAIGIDALEYPNTGHGNQAA
ncbi:heavy metal sensor histidine kinase [Uliginosibacterium gangwonense]|uniref:heavy metal sensor histidine kinase n=1 Tax=Uliginosibacterium gangwonense TaxID=392736 RepID=UPI00036FB0A3|nr:heavy metal sensor histidine kinase [Uliginosibacterium gangwonense]